MCCAFAHPVHAGGNILQPGIALAGRDIGLLGASSGPLGRPGASEGAPEPHVAGVAGAGRGTVSGWRISVIDRSAKRKQADEGDRKPEDPGSRLHVDGC